MSEPGTPPQGDYEFTNAWFEQTARQTWDDLLPGFAPRRVLEIGSYEGASAAYLVETLAACAPLELHCIDTWGGGIEHDGVVDMAEVERRFGRNLKRALSRAAHAVDLHVHKAASHLALARLLADGRAGYFDFVYIDGSHQAPDVLIDAVLGFKLLRIEGLMAFDDYAWAEALPAGKDLLRCPKPAIDAFTNIHFRKTEILYAPLYQLYIRKTAD